MTPDHPPLRSCSIKIKRTEAQKKSAGTLKVAFGVFFSRKLSFKMTLFIQPRSQGFSPPSPPSPRLHHFMEIVYDVFRFIVCFRVFLFSFTCFVVGLEGYDFSFTLPLRTVHLGMHEAFHSLDISWRVEPVAISHSCVPGNAHGNQHSVLGTRFPSFCEHRVFLFKRNRR